MRASTWTLLFFVLGPVPASGQDGSTTGVVDVSDGTRESSRAVVFDAKQRRKIARLSPLGAPPPSPTNRVADDPRARALGHFLFFDPRLSSNGEISCATCHVPELGFSDGKPLAEGLARGSRHTPTIWNVAYQRWFFWDGRADSLWSQALGPLENPIEMGTDRLAIAHVVQRDADLRRAYEALFGNLPELDERARFPEHGRPVPESVDDPLDRAWNGMEATDRQAIDRVFSNLGKAFEAYERQLVRRDAPFDRFAAQLLQADGAPTDALGPAAQHGLEIFLGRGRCTLCHVGPNLSDREFHNTSAPPLAGADENDPGRYRGSQLVARSPFNAASPYSDAPDGTAARRVASLRQTSESWGEFKTPSLRNLANRGPYMHQGQFPSLEDVVRFYSTLEGSSGRSHHQEQVLVPLRLNNVEEAALVAFLDSLSGAPIDPYWLSAPNSPLVSGPR
ncbi:MAG: cytochrome c peroxidase [Chlamydiales bacterium]|jgi:cytochrome c peroxidase